ncbi:hypothetical protein Tco_1110507 [Tanacetum coccineum]|uniref:Uncharacterized protein n=1 Tax=Tanacetum coccineum TaxID=301880 RepID=A0ABQ5IJ90_9ASTR
MDTSKPLLKDAEAKDVDVHLYRSIIRSLMYLTASRPDIMFAVCACARFQVTPKGSHFFNAVKRNIDTLKSDYAGVSLDRKSTTRGCQFLESKLISWQCKKQTIVANSTTEAEYVAASSFYGQVLWIQNQMLDYGYNFMNTKIFIDSESIICIVMNPVFHSKTRHIKIRHHFISDSNEKKLIQMIKIQTDHNVAYFASQKAFDVGRFQYLIATNDEIQVSNVGLPYYCEGFQEIVDFLNGSHIRYALTKNPTIYVSLIKKFWQTSTVRTVDNGEQEITATVDGKEFTVTKASVRRHLQLADVDGISVLPTTKIFDQLSLMGYVLIDDKLTFQKEEGEGSGHPSEPQPPPSTAQPTNEEPILNVIEAVYEEWDDRVERATTTAASLDAEQASGGSPRSPEAMGGGSIAQTRSERVPTPPRDSPLPRVHTLGSDEGSMTLQELTVLCTTLSKKVEILEADLKQTKQVFGAAYTKLIMKVKKLEKTVKTSHSRRRAKIVVSDDEEDSKDSSKQGRMIEEIDQDAGVTLVTPT